MSVAGKDQFQTLLEEKDHEIERLKACLEAERANYNNKLKEIQDYYESILEVMPGHVYWLDKNNVYLGCNHLLAQDAKLQSRSEIIGKTNYDLPWKDQAGELNRLNKLVLDTGTVHTAEEYVVMANGLVIYFSTKIPLRNKNDEIIGILGVSIDITERKKMEVALRRAKEAAELLNHAKTDFIANMHHDIHAPLKGIVGLARLLEENTQNALDKQYASWIAESGLQIIELLHNVLNKVAAEQFNTTEVHEDLFDLRQNLQGIYNLVLPTVKLKNLELNLDIDERLPDKLITDGTKLKRVLLNLLSNAIKFTKKGEITIQVKVLTNAHKYVQLQFSVIDTGIGIPEDIQTKIFGRFYRANSEESKGHEGDGVGLPMAQNYVGLLGGEIKLESVIDKGSQFYFTLPIKVVGTEFDESSTNKVNQPLQLLIIEPNIVALQVIEGLAMQTGCNYKSAMNVKQAVKLLNSVDFDLVITDIELPGFPCEELVRTLRGKERKKSPPIIGLSTQSLKETNAISSAGIDKIISKPLRLETMQALVDEYSVST